MKIPERIEWINQNKMRGDVTGLAVELKLPPSTVRDIIIGKFVGRDGERVLRAIEKRITRRMQAQEKIRNKYKSKLVKSD